MPLAPAALGDALAALAAHPYPDLPSPARVPKRASVALVLRVRPAHSSLSPSHSHFNSQSQSSRPTFLPSPSNAPSRSRSDPGQFTFPPRPDSDPHGSDTSSTFTGPPRSQTTPHDQHRSSKNLHQSGFSHRPIGYETDPDETVCEANETARTLRIVDHLGQSVLSEELPPPSDAVPSLTPSSSPLSEPDVAASVETQLRAFFSLPAIQAGQVELLFIKRTSRPTDRWGGHIAFPGGGREPADQSDEDTARRETLEEVGLDIDRLAKQVYNLDSASSPGSPVRMQACIPIGGLPQRLISSAWGRSPLLTLCPYVYILTVPTITGGTDGGPAGLNPLREPVLPPLALQPAEVASVHWVPLDAIVAPENRRVWSYSLQGVCLARNSRRSGGHVRRPSRKSQSGQQQQPPPSPPVPAQPLLKSVLINPFLRFSEWLTSSLDMPAVQLVPGESVWAVSSTSASPNCSPTIPSATLPGAKSVDAAPVSFLGTVRRSEHLLLWGLTLGMAAELVALVEAAHLDTSVSATSDGSSTSSSVQDDIVSRAQAGLVLGDSLSYSDAPAGAFSNPGFDLVDQSVGSSIPSDPSTDDSDLGFHSDPTARRSLTFFQFAHALPRPARSDVGMWMGLVESLDGIGLGFGLASGKDSVNPRGRDRRDRRDRHDRARRTPNVDRTLPAPDESTSCSVDPEPEVPCDPREQVRRQILQIKEREQERSRRAEAERTGRPLDLTRSSARGIPLLSSLMTTFSGLTGLGSDDAPESIPTRKAVASQRPSNRSGAEVDSAITPVQSPVTPHVMNPTTPLTPAPISESNESIARANDSVQTHRRLKSEASASAASLPTFEQQSRVSSQSVSDRGRQLNSGSSAPATRTQSLGSLPHQQSSPLDSPSSPHSTSSPALQTTLALLAASPTTKTTHFARFVTVLRRAVIAAVITRLALSLAAVASLVFAIRTVLTSNRRRQQYRQGRDSKSGLSSGLFDEPMVQWIQRGVAALFGGRDSTSLQRARVDGLERDFVRSRLSGRGPAFSPRASAGLRSTRVVPTLTSGSAEVSTRNNRRWA